jgi:hypothetical protein
MGMPEAAPEMLSIKTGSLDPEFTDISPLESEVYVTNRNAYIKPFDGLTQFDGMLPL